MYPAAEKTNNPKPLSTQRAAIANRLGMAGVYENSSLNLQVFKKTDTAGTVFLLGYRGKCKTKDFYRTFPNEAEAREFMNRWISHSERDHRISLLVQNELEAQSLKKHDFSVGNVLYRKCGDNNKDIEYYQIINLVEPQSVEIRKIGRQTDNTGYAQGECVPFKNRFIGEPLTRQINHFGFEPGILITNHSTAYKVKSIQVAGMEIFEPLKWEGTI